MRIKKGAGELSYRIGHLRLFLHFLFEVVVLVEGALQVKAGVGVDEFRVEA